MADVNEPQAQEDTPVEGSAPEHAESVTENNEQLDDMSQGTSLSQQEIQENQRRIFEQANPQSLQASNKTKLKTMRTQQRLISQQEKSQGRTHAFGYFPMAEAKGDFLQFQQAMFGESVFNKGGFTEFDEKAKAKRKQLEQEFQEMYLDKGKEIPKEQQARLRSFDEKLFEGFRLDKTMGGGSIMSFRLQDGVGRSQQIFDDGNSVRACTNGPFNSKTAMAMAAVFWGDRVNGNTESMDVRIDTKRTLGGALGGVKAKEKQDSMIIANLHMSMKFGIPANISGSGIGDCVHEYREQAGNEADLNAALFAYNQELINMGEDPIESLDALFNQEFNDGMALSGEAHDGDGPAPTSENDGNTPPGNDGGGGSALVAAKETAPDTETPVNEAEIIGPDEEIDFREAEPLDDEWRVVGINMPENGGLGHEGDANAPQALSHDPSLDKQQPAEGGVPTFKTQRDPNSVVASEPRQSHGNDVPARSEWVQGMINAEKAKNADAALGGQDQNLPAVPGATAVINPAQKADDAAGPKQPDKRIQGPTGTPGM